MNNKSQQAINADGAWMRVPVDVLSRVANVGTHAALTAEFTHVAKQILVVIPDTPNRMRRKKAASVLMEKLASPGNTTKIGEPLKQRLKKIADGSWPEKKDDQDDEEDADGDEPAEPAAKKAKKS